MFRIRLDMGLNKSLSQLCSFVKMLRWPLAFIIGFSIPPLVLGNFPAGRFYENAGDPLDDKNKLEIQTEKVSHFYYKTIYSINSIGFKRAQQRHELDSMIMLVFSGLFVLIVLTSWYFKHHRLRFIHETGLTLIYGLFLGLILRYTDFGNVEEQSLEVKARNGSVIYIPPDYLRLSVSKPNTNTTIHFHYEMAEGYYSDTVVSILKTDCNLSRILFRVRMTNE